MTPIALPELSAGGWIDLVCAVAFGIALLVGAVRGLTGQAARLFALVSGFSAVGALHAETRNLAFFADSPVLALAAAVVGGAVVAVAVRAFVARFLRLVVGQPADAILGAALTGLVCALAIGFAFSVAEMIPADLPGKAAVEESATGRIVRPLARKMAGFKAPAPTTAESAR